MAVRVTIDKRACQSSGNCVAGAPEAFGWDDDDLGHVLTGAAGLPLARLVEIARRCPARCIEIIGEDGAEIEVDPA